MSNRIKLEFCQQTTNRYNTIIGTKIVPCSTMIKVHEEVGVHTADSWALDVGA